MSDQPPPLDRKTPETASGTHRLLGAFSDPGRYALFLDIDGTLLDLAAKPDDIVVPEGLPMALDRLSRHLGGALGLVTGRGLDYADRLFSPFLFPIAGLHGAERRMPDGRIERVDITAEFRALKKELAEEVAGWDGVLIEDKGAAVAAHYRLAPVRQADVEALMERARQRSGTGWEIQRGKMVVELRPATADKGRAVESFLATAPFTGRLPVTIGDDVTDEAMFRVANRLGGLSIRIAPPGQPSEAAARIASAVELRAILQSFTG